MNDTERRLVLLLAAAVAPSIALTVSSGDTGSSSPDSADTGSSIECIPWISEIQGPCPPPEAQYPDGLGCAYKPLGPAVDRGDSCCYEVHEHCIIGCTGCNHGRSLGLAVSPPVFGAPGDAPAWFDPALPAPDRSSLDADRLARLALLWANIGAMEHASIGSFHIFSLDLLAHRAPPDLLQAAARAALDETRHARHAFTLARAFAGRAVGPGPSPDTPPTPARDLAELAARTVAAACVGETLSVIAASTMAASAHDPAVRRVLDGIVRDEMRHALLAWRAVSWAMAQGGAEVRSVARETFASTPTPLGSAHTPYDPLLARFGCVGSDRIAHAVRRARSTVVDPLAEAMCA